MVLGVGGPATARIPAEDLHGVLRRGYGRGVSASGMNVGAGMPEEALVSLAMAGGTAVVQTAGTQAWDGLRVRVARLLGRGDGERERTELDRLDRTASASEAQPSAEVDQARLRQEASWQTRFEALLEDVDGPERERVVAELRALVQEQPASGEVSAGDHGVAVGGSVEVRADHGSVAALRVGGVRLGNPSLAETVGPGDGLAVYQQALLLAREVAVPLEEARALDGSARCRLRTGDRETAIENLRQALAIYQRLGVLEAQPAADLLASLEAEAPDSAER